MTLTPERLNELIADCKSPADVDKLYSRMLQQMINRSLNAEMDAHLDEGRRSHAQTSTGPASQSRPRRNGVTTKTVQSLGGGLDIATPRDRDGSFEPQLLKKRQVRPDGIGRHGRQDPDALCQGHDDP